MYILAERERERAWINKEALNYLRNEASEQRSRWQPKSGVMELLNNGFKFLFNDFFM